MRFAISMLCTGMLACASASSVQAQQLQTPDIQTTIDDTFRWPWAITVDDAGNIYGTDRYYNTVRVFTPSGGTYTSANIITSNHMLSSPRAIAIGSNGHLFVGESSGVTEFEPQSANIYNAVAHIGQDVFNDPYGIAIAVSGDVLVADSGNTKVRRFSPLTEGGYVEQDIVASNNYFYDVAVDPEGNVFVANTYPHLIQEYRWNGTGYPATPDVALDTGSGDVYSVALDRYGNLYAADHNGGRIVKFTADGQGGYSSAQLLANVGPGTSFRPSYLTVDRMLNVYVILTDAYSGVLIKIGDRVFADGME